MQEIILARGYGLFQPMSASLMSKKVAGKSGQTHVCVCVFVCVCVCGCVWVSVCEWVGWAHVLKYTEKLALGLAKHILDASLQELEEQGKLGKRVRCFWTD